METSLKFWVVWIGIFFSLLLTSTEMVGQARRFASEMFSNPNSWSQGSSVAMTNVTGTHRHITTANGTGDRYFRFYSETSGGTWYQPAPNDQFVNLNTTITLNATGCCDNKAYFINAPNTSDNYVFLTRPNGGNQELRILRIGGTIRAVANAGDVSRVIAGGGSTVYRSMDVTVKATLDGAKHADQGVYLRYTNNNFATSTIVEMTLDAGNTYQATIPAGTNTAGSTVIYYVFTSRSGETIAPADADFMTINLQNNGGSNYSYVVNSAYATKTGTLNWNTASSWWGDAVPPASSAVAITGNVTLNTDATVSEVSIQSGATLNAGNQTLTIDGGAGSRFINNGTFNAGAGTITFTGAGPKTVNGAVVFNNVNISTGVQFNTNSNPCTINGVLSINSGGFVSTYAPIYATGSTLLYNTGGTYNRSTEWGDNITSGPGYPSSVRISGNTTLDLNANGNGPKTCGSNLDIDAGSTLTNVGNGSTHSRVMGNLVVNGTINFTSGSLAVRGNLVLQSTSAINQTNVSNGLILEGSTNTIIDGSGATLPSLQGLAIQKSSSSARVNLQKPLTITNSLFIITGVLETNGNLNTGTGQVAISIGSTTTLGSMVEGYGTIGGELNITYTLNNSIQLMGSEIPSGSEQSKINSVTITGGFCCFRGIQLTQNINIGNGKSISVTGGGLFTGEFTLSGAGTLNVNSSGYLAIGHADGYNAAITINNQNITAGTIVYNRTGAQNSGGFSFPVTVRVQGNTNLTLSDDISCNDLILETSSTFNGSDNTLTLNATSGTALTRFTSTTFNAGTGTVVFNGTGTKSVAAGTTFRNVVIANGGVTFGANNGSCTINGALQLNPGGFLASYSVVYFSNGTLVYNTGGTYGRSNEWTPDSNPKGITIQNNTTLNVGNGSNVARNVDGNVTIEAGSTMNYQSINATCSIFGNLVVDGTLTLSTASGGDLAIQGNATFNTGSTFNAISREVLFNGSGTQTLTAYSNPTFAYLRVNQGSSSVFQLAGDITIGNGFNPSKLTLQAGSYNLNGYTIATSGTSSNSLEIFSNASVITGGTALHSGWTHYRNGVDLFNALGGTIAFNDDGPETLPAIVFNTVVLLGSGTKSLSGNTTINGALGLNNNNVTLNRGVYNLTYGNLATLSYLGTGSRTASGELDFNTTLSSIFINLTTGTLTIPNGTIVVNSTLALSASNIILSGSSELILGTSGSSPGSIFGSGKIIGPLTRWISTTSGVRQFQIGSADLETKQVGINFTSAPSAAGTVRVQYVAGSPANPSNGLPIVWEDSAYSSVVSTGYWSVTAGNGLTGGTYNITFNGTGLAGFSDFRALRLVKRANSSSNWEILEANQVPTSGSNAAPILSMTGLTSFSEFAAIEGSELGPLPVSLSSFTGKLLGGQATLNWVTVSEKDNAGFVVERSLNASGAYERLGFVKGNGTTANRNTYAFSDANAPIAAYYRLIQQDLDGKETVYGPIFLQDEVGVERSLSLWPNPVLPNTVLELKGAPVPNERVSLRIANAIGQIIWEGSDENTTILNLVSEKIKSLGRGKYWLQGSVNDQNLKSVSFVVK